ncbi:MAG: sce7725 family protein [Lachnospiraceae bacterium]|nr:sce7725 family protein [Lachnospiraceae bacterium]
MYFPYLRGRQNELLCLRELLDSDRLYNTIIPVIEPVRCNSTFFSTITKFIEADRKIIIIKNPKVGKFRSDYEEMKKKIDKETDEDKKDKLQSTLESYKELLKDPHVISAYLCDDRIISQCLEGKKNLEDIILINTRNDTFDYYEENGDRLVARYTFIPKDEDFKDEVFGETVILEDVYVKAKRNVDYIENPDEPFSRNHLVYRKRGYVGFSDYSIVGDSYEESGFAPLAVAIHILYFGQKSELRVHHFVSESNENISDPARKFAEAMQNLLSWEHFDVIPKTNGLQNLLDYYSNGKFPGLGVIKKCSIMHHLELIGKYLEVNE